MNSIFAIHLRLFDFWEEHSLTDTFKKWLVCSIFCPKCAKLEFWIFFWLQHRAYIKRLHSMEKVLKILLSYQEILLFYQEILLFQQEINLLCFYSDFMHSHVRKTISFLHTSATKGCKEKKQVLTKRPKNFSWPCLSQRFQIQEAQSRQVLFESKMLQIVEGFFPMKLGT